MAMTARSQGFCADTPPEVAVCAFTPSPPEHLLWARGSRDAGDSLGTQSLSPALPGGGVGGHPTHHERRSRGAHTLQSLSRNPGLRLHFVEKTGEKPGHYQFSIQTTRSPGQQSDPRPKPETLAVTQLVAPWGLSQSGTLCPADGRDSLQRPAFGHLGPIPHFTLAKETQRGVSY